MAEKKKVVYVDFRKRRKPTRGGFGGTPRQLFTLFLGVLALELLVAAFYPHWIASGFFAPTVIAVAVAATLGARRVAARYQISRLHKSTLEKDSAFRRDDDQSGRTLH